MKVKDHVIHRSNIFLKCHSVGKYVICVSINMSTQPSFISYTCQAICSSLIVF